MSTDNSDNWVAALDKALTREWFKRAYSDGTPDLINNPNNLWDTQMLCPEEDEDMSNIEKVSQWATHNGGYYATKRTVRELPPGIYGVEIIDQTLMCVPKTLTTDNIIRLPDSMSDVVLAEVEHFWNSRETFQKFGLMHKRGFLLHGPAGSGKSVTLEMVSMALVKTGGIVLIPKIQPAMTSTMLTSIRNIEPERNIVVIFEDLDDTIRTFGEDSMLALLDGDNAVDHVCYLATTNYPERLPPRLLNRPSRFDRIMHIGMPNAESRRLYIQSRGFDLPDDHLDYWVDLTKGLSIAHLKEVGVCVYVYGMRVEDAVDRMHNMFTTPTSDEHEGQSSPKKKVVGFADDDDDSRYESPMPKYASPGLRSTPLVEPGFK